MLTGFQISGRFPEIMTAHLDKMFSVDTLLALLAISATVATCAAGMIGVASFNPSFREGISNSLQRMNLGTNSIVAGMTLWAKAFVTLFGKRYISLRFFIVVPIYTLAVSAVFFVIWYAMIITLRNNSGDILATPPISFQQAAKQYYWGGFIVSVAIDSITILLTKKCLHIFTRRGGVSLRFVAMVIFSFFLTYIILITSINMFRIYDMVRLYAELAPGDTMPIMPFELFPSSMNNWLYLVDLPTTIHFTSAGAFSTYFMPEPILFYCALSGQISILFFAFLSVIFIFLFRLRNFMSGVFSLTETPEFHAKIFIIFSLSALASMAIAALLLLAMALERSPA